MKIFNIQTSTLLMLNGIWCSKVAEAVIYQNNPKSKKKNETPFKTVKMTLYVLILRTVIIPFIY